MMPPLRFLAPMDSPMREAALTSPARYRYRSGRNSMNRARSFDEILPGAFLVIMRPFIGSGSAQRHFAEW